MIPWGSQIYAGIAKKSRKELLMPEETKNTTAETTDGAGAVGVDGNADVDKDTNDSDNVNDADFSDGGADDPKDPESDGDKPDEEKPVKKDVNTENARRRREAERKAELDKARREARETAIIDALGGKNPYTGEEMKDSSDVREFELMREIEKKGGDPVADYAKHVKERERADKAAKEKADSDAAWYQKDYEDFSKKHPEADFEKLSQDPTFIKFSDGKVGRIPLSKIYEDFIDVTSEYDKKAEEKARQILANNKATPGALSGGSSSDNGYYTREQVQKMTQKEVSENYDKILKSMKKWKN